MHKKSYPLFPGSHLNIRFMPDVGVELGYTHHFLRLSPDPKGKLFKEAWSVFKRKGMSFKTEDYRRLLSDIRSGRLEIKPGGRYQPATGTLQPSKGWDILYPLELFLSNGTSFVVMKTDKATYLEIGLKGHLPLLFDITLPGCPYEQAIWVLEKRWPDCCRG